jgi:hypothetical protein
MTQSFIRKTQCDGGFDDDFAQIVIGASVGKHFSITSVRFNARCGTTDDKIRARGLPLEAFRSFAFIPSARV